MALSRTRPANVTFLFRDNNRRNGSTGLFLPSGLWATLASLDAGVNEVRDALIPLSDAQFRGASISQPYTEDAVGAAPPASSEIERKLVLIWRTASQAAPVISYIPSPVFSIEQVGTDEVALTNPLIVALRDAVVNGPFGPGNGPTDNRGVEIVELERAYVEHRG